MRNPNVFVDAEVQYRSCMMASVHGSLLVLKIGVLCTLNFYKLQILEHQWACQQYFKFQHYFT